VRAAFGDEVFGPDGRVDRRSLGRVVFADAERLQTLNGIVHPAVVERCADEVARARATGAPLAVVDAALLLEVPMTFDLDLTLALRCDRDERVRRMLRRLRVGPRDRLDRQAGMEKHFYKADAVIDTGRDLAAVLADVDALVDAVVKRKP
jgi:dephospho-CoA kinase